MSLRSWPPSKGQAPAAGSPAGHRVNATSSPPVTSCSPSRAAPVTFLLPRPLGDGSGTMPGMGILTAGPVPDGFTGTRTGVCNLCEAICGLELTLEDGPGHLDPGQRRRPALARAHLPQGRRARGRLRGPRPAAAPDPAGRLRRRREWVRDRLGRGARPGRRRAGRRHQRPRPERGGRLPRQPQRPLARVRRPTALPMVKALRHPQPVQRLLGRPDPPPVRRLAALRAPAAAADPRHRPDVVLPGRRRQPDGVQRLADDRAGLPQPAAGAEEARRPDGRPRPAAHRDREGRHRAPLRPARLRRRACCWRCCTCCSRRG